MSNVDKTAQKLVSSIRPGKAPGKTGAGKAAKKKAPASGKASSRKPSAGKHSAAAAKPRAKATRAPSERQRPDNPGRAGYAIGGLRWPD